jgi:hypothetical protein
MNNNNLEDELLDEELTEFFNDDTNDKDKKEDKKEDVNLKVKQLLDTFNVQKNYESIVNIKDAKEVKKMIETVRNNLSSLEAVYGADVVDQLRELLEMEEEITRKLQEFFNNRDEMIKKFMTVDNMSRNNDVPEEIRKAFIQYVALNPELDSVFLYYQLSNMIDRRYENMANNEGGQGTAVSQDEGLGLLEAGAAVVGYKAGEKAAQIYTAENKEEYLKNFYNKVKIIEQATGVTLDEEFIKFFTSDEYIMANDLKLPPMLQDENYDKLKDTWSLPDMINDLRAEEADKELYAANDSIKSLENHFAVNYNDTKDNSVIETLKGLSSDVTEEKNRIEQDIEFLKKEKLKERVEVAILASVAGNTENKKIDTLANLLKETITSRVNYMKDENNLRDMRKENIKDMSNKDNERNSKDYFDALQGVNVAINKRREERAAGNVKFTPKILQAKNELKKNEISNDEKSINSQNLSMGGRQKVLTYVNRYSNNNNIAS